MKVRSSAFDSTASAAGGGGDTTLPLGHDAYVQEIPRSIDRFLRFSSLPRYRSSSIVLRDCFYVSSFRCSGFSEGWKDFGKSSAYTVTRRVGNKREKLGIQKVGWLRYFVAIIEIEGVSSMEILYRNEGSLAAEMKRL